MKEKGVAIIMAMWLLAVLAIIGTTFAFMMRLEPIIARTHRDDIQAIYITQAGIDHAAYWLRRDTDLEIDSLAEDWATYFSGSEVDNDGDGTADSKWITLTDDEDGNAFGYYAVLINDEGGKVSLNNPLADNSPWKNLLDGLSISAATAQNIINYQAGTYGPFETMDELACVNGISGDGYSVYFRKAKVHHENFPATPTTRLPINVNTAGEEALRAALGELTGSTYAILKVTNTNINRVVDAIIAYRSGEDKYGNNMGDGNPNPFDGIDTNRNDHRAGTPKTDTDNIGTFLTDLDPDTLSDGDYIFLDTNDYGTADADPRDEFNAFINYLCVSGYLDSDGRNPLVSGNSAVKITFAYVRDNIKDNFDAGVDYDNYDSNCDVADDPATTNWREDYATEGNQDNCYRCPDCHIVVKNPTADNPTTCPKCERAFTVDDPPERIYNEIDRDGTYEPGLCPNHGECPMGGKVMSRDASHCPKCEKEVTPTAHPSLDFSADPETYTTNFCFANKNTGNDQYFEIISTGKYLSPSGREILKRIRVIVDRGRTTAGNKNCRVWYYKEIPED